MAEFPAMPLFTAEYMTDTADLTMKEHGLYMLMLMVAWRRDDTALPNDMSWLKRTLGAYCADGVHGRTFNAFVPNILDRFWHIGLDGKWHQKRLDKEKAYLREKSATNRNIAIAKHAAIRAEKLKSERNQIEIETKPNLNASETHGSSQSDQHDNSCERSALTLNSHSHKKERKKEQTTFVPKKESDAPPSGVADKPATRGHRLPDDWKPTEADTAFAKASGFSDDAVAEMAAEFRDYWGAIPGQRGVKLDWSATWRNNIRNRHRSADVIARRQPKKSRSQEMMELYDETFSRTRDQETRTSTPVLSIVR